MTSTHTGSKTSLCSVCGLEIGYNPIILNGIDMEIAPNICSDCENKREQNMGRELRQCLEEEKHKRRADKERHWLKICPPLYRNTDPTRIPGDKLNKVMSWQYNPKGLVLHGVTGRFKSRCAYLLLKRLHDEGHRIAAFDSTDFVNQVSDKFYDGTGGAWIENLIKVPVFYIDDLGNEPSGERGAGEIWHIIKRRGEELLPVIITTNSVGEELSGKLKGPQDRGSGMVRRLREFCEPIAF